MLNKFKAVIFDFDGVIVSSEPLHYRALIQALKALDLSLSEADYIRQFIGVPDRQTMRLLLEQHNISVSEAEFNKLITIKSTAFLQAINAAELPPQPGLLQLIAIIQQQTLPMAIATGSTRAEVEGILTRLAKGDVLKAIRFIVPSDEVTRAKPDPECYLTAASLLKVAAADCLAIEDSPTGIQAAKAAGMTVVGVATTHPKIQLRQADHVFDDLLALVNTL